MTAAIVLLKNRNAVLAQVYKALLDGLTEVAIKFVRAERSSSTSALQKFEMEINIMRACKSEKVVRFLGAWVLADSMYMVQE